jgi:hypothetical protein
VAGAEAMQFSERHRLREPGSKTHDFGGGLGAVAGL